MNEIQTTQTTSLAPQALKREQIELIKRTCAKDATDDELQLFVAYCNNKGVNPLSKEIYFTKYNGQVNFLTSYHFLIAKVQETHEFEGMTMALFCGKDGVWKDLWIEKEPPLACKVGVYRKGYREAVWSVRYMDEAMQSNPQWKKQPLQMLRKATIVDALRLAFDDVLRGMYIVDEMPIVQQQETILAEKPIEPFAPGWEKQVIPHQYLPAELKDKGYTFESLASDYDAEHFYVSAETGTACQVRHILHVWQTSKAFADSKAKLAADRLLEMYPSKTKETT